MQQHRQLKDVCGFSTIELLFAFALATVFLSGAARIVFGSQTIGLDVALTRSAQTSVVTQLGKAIASTTSAWHALLPVQSGFYTKQNVSTSISPCLKEIESSTLWNTEHGRGQHVTVRTSLGSVSEARAQGGGCDPFSPIDLWDNPSSFGSVDVAGSDGTGIAVRGISGNTYAFITASSSAPIGADFIVVDSTNAQAPSVVGAPLTAFKGLSGIAVGGAYAYVLNTDNASQLRVINIANPLTPYEEVSAVRTLPNLVSTCTPITAPCLSGKTIDYYGGRLYIGTSYIAFGTSVQNHELHVYCVDDSLTSGCSPQTPVWLGSFNVNRNVNDIAVRIQKVGGVVKTLAYLALSGSTNTLPELRVFDVSLPSSIYEVGSFNPSGTLYGTSITLLGDTAYLGRERASGAQKDLYILDVSNPASIVERSSRKLGIGVNTAVAGIAVSGSFAFVATSDSSKPLFVLNVSDPSSPTSVSTCSLSSAQQTSDVVYHDNLLYSVNRNNELVRILYDQPSSCI